MAKRPAVALCLFFPAGILLVLFLNDFTNFVLSHQYIPVFEKARYILVNNETFTEADLNGGKYLWAISTFTVLCVLLKRKITERNMEWLSLLCTTAFLYTVFLLIPQFSLRSTLLISQILLGWLFVMIVSPVSWYLVRSVFTIILIRKMMSLLNQPSNELMAMWGQFPYWEWIPGYFFIGQ
jgi:hypothetical protein